MSVLMDYCLYHPEPVRRNLVAKYLEKSPPPADSDEMIALRAMTEAYYPLFQITEVERGVGVTVQDLPGTRLDLSWISGLVTPLSGT